MNPANLPFDSEAMLAGLRGWVECESPTWDAQAGQHDLGIKGKVGGVHRDAFKFERMSSAARLRVDGLRE